MDAQGAALSETVLPLLSAHDKRLEGVDDAIGALIGRLNAADRELGRHAELIAYLATFDLMPFWQRLWWIVTGHRR